MSDDILQFEAAMKQHYGFPEVCFRKSTFSNRTYYSDDVENRFLGWRDYRLMQAPHPHPDIGKQDLVEKVARALHKHNVGHLPNSEDFWKKEHNRYRTEANGILVALNRSGLDVVDMEKRDE